MVGVFRFLRLYGFQGVVFLGVSDVGKRFRALLGKSSHSGFRG